MQITQIFNTNLANYTNKFNENDNENENRENGLAVSVERLAVSVEGRELYFSMMLLAASANFEGSASWRG